jgi:nucleotide-binding universal stress UspA family protein
MFENILVCLDGSKLSEAILPLAAELAKRFGSRVVLLNVIVVPTVLAGFGKTEIEPTQSTQFSEQESEQEEESNYYLESIAGTLREKGLDVECVTVEGTIEESIITYARNYEIGLIALSTHGNSGLSRFILRSTTEFILRKSGIPVLAICPRGTPVLNAGDRPSRFDS